MNLRKIFGRLSVLLFILIAGCFPGADVIQITQVSQQDSLPTTTQLPSHTPLPSFTTRPPATLTQTPSQTPLPSHTLAPTLTLTPSISPTPTFDFPDFTVQEPQANCRYGPGTAYLYAAALYAGDHAEVRGRNYSGSWLYLRPDSIDYFCWAAASVGEVQGDIFRVVVWAPNLPKTTFVGPVKEVRAVRDGDQVTITWSPVKVKPLEDGRGYLIEANVCQNGALLSVAVHTDGNSYTFSDDPACGNSSGLLYAVEKHGYTDPIEIPWP